MDTSNPSQPKGKRSGLRDKADALGREVYWITLSAKDDAKPFGSTRGGETVLNARGKAVAACWRELADIRPGLEPDALVIGPRRFQGLLLLSPKGKDKQKEKQSDKKRNPEKEPINLAEAIKLFKVVTSLRLAQLAKTADMASGPKVAGGTRASAVAKAPGALWKKGFLEKAISGSFELAEARKAFKGLQAR